MNSATGRLPVAPPRKRRRRIAILALCIALITLLLPREELKDALISPALSHASFEGEPGAWDRFRLVHFMAEVLALAS